jgi:ribosome-associated protein
MTKPLTSEQLKPELEFSATRSSGAGGQHVNKVSSKIVLRWNMRDSKIASAEQKELLLQKLKSYLTLDGTFILTGQEHRSQLQNKDSVIEKLDQLLERAFKKVKVRRPGKPSKAAIKKRLEGKRIHSEKKQSRKKF